MVWFKADDNLLDHPKWIGLPDASKVLWLEAGLWSARHLTEGFVPTTYLTSRGGNLDATIRALVSRGLWERVSGGYQFHDWLIYQRAKETVLAERKANAERQARYREARRNGSRNAVTNAGSNETPTRPDPPPKGGEGRRRATPAARADLADAPTPPAEPGPPCRSCGNRISSAYHRRHCREELTA